MVDVIKVLLNIGFIGSLVLAAAVVEIFIALMGTAVVLLAEENGL